MPSPIDVFFGKQQLAVLQFIANAAPNDPSVADIARHLRCHYNTAATMVRRMLGDGLITVSPTVRATQGGACFLLAGITDEVLIRRISPGFLRLLRSLWRTGGGNVLCLGDDMRLHDDDEHPMTPQNIMITLRRMVSYEIVVLSERQNLIYAEACMPSEAALLQIAYNTLSPRHQEDTAS